MKTSRIKPAVAEPHAPPARLATNASRQALSLAMFNSEIQALTLELETRTWSMLICSVSTQVMQCGQVFEVE